jgi:pyruvate/2-oxoglutarate dehydrogenase complex dihydrolipoamide dehydrogenase (E3) component
LASRFLLRDTVQQRFGDKLKAFNEGFAKDGMFYLLTLRLVPYFPFVAINLLMGLTSIRVRTYYWVSQVGMLAGTIVYVNAGTQLATVQSLKDIASPTLLLSFTLLGVFPLLAKAINDWIAARRVYARWTRPAKYDRNVVVIGAGAGGLVSALISATVKAKVTLVENHKMGGDCLNFGCVPSKALIRTAKLAHQMTHANRYGLEPSAPRFNFRKVMARVHEVIRTIEPHDSVERYTGLGVDVVQGYATLVDPWTVEIARRDGGKQKLTTRSIIIATGAQPFVPPLPGIEQSGYVTSDTVWDEFAKLEAPPQRLIVLGGGPIGCELAQCFARLGSQVTQVEMMERIMLREDPEVAELALSALQADGVRVLTGHKALRCEQRNGTKILIVEQGGQQHAIEFDALLCAVGRSARMTGYGLEKLGIVTERTIACNEYLETKYPNILAVGDVVGPYQFTHVAAHQAWYAAVNALFGQFKKFKADYSVIPWTTFIDPEVARVGLNEADAKKQGIAYEVTRFDMHELDRAIADSATKGFVKVLTKPGKDKILGVTIVAEHAGELITEYVTAMRHGLGLGKILGTIHTYPTMAEANKYAAGEWRKARKPEQLLTWVERYHAFRRG